MDASPVQSERVQAETDALSLQLRAATRLAHEALEATPFSQRLSDGSLDLSAYARYLAAMRHFHKALEDVAASSTHPAVKSVWQGHMRRAPALERDLKALAGGGLVEEAAVEPGTVAPIAALMSEIDGDDRQLIGVLYVSEGSRLGGRVLRKSLLARYPGLADGGLAYLDGHGDQTGQRWTEFRARLDDLALDAEGESVIVEGAVAGFRAVQAVFAAL